MGPASSHNVKMQAAGAAMTQYHNHAVATARPKNKPNPDLRLWENPDSYVEKEDDAKARLELGLRN